MFRWIAEVFFSRRLIRLIPGGWILVLLTSPPLRFVWRRVYARLRVRFGPDTSARPAPGPAPERPVDLAAAPELTR